MRSAGYGPGHRVGLLLENRPAFFRTGSRSMRSASASCRSTPTCARTSWGYLIGHSEIALGGRRCRRREATLRAAAAEAGTHARHDPPPRPRGRIPAARTPARRGRAADRRATPSARCSTPRAPPAGRRAASSPTTTSCAPATGTLGLGELCEVAAGRRAHDHAAAADPHERAGVLDDGDDPVRRLPSSSSTASIRARWWHSVRDSARDGRPLPRRDAGDAARGAAAATRREHSVRFGFGAGVDPRHHAAFEERFGFPLIEAWAMTETGAGAVRHGATASRATSARAASAAPKPPSTTRLVDDEGTDVPARRARRAAGARHRAPTRGAASSRLSQGRAGDRRGLGRRLVPHRRRRAAQTPTATCTSSTARRTSIRRSGENISAVEVESVLNQHPAVPRAAVAATPDAMRGDEVLACIVLREPPTRRRAAEARARASSRHCARAGSPTTRRRATSPSSTPCRSRRRRRSSAASWRAGAQPARRGALHRHARDEEARDASDEKARDSRGLRRRRGRRAGHRAVRALLDARRALVPRPRARRRWSKAPGIAKEQIDGLSVSSFSLVPDTAVGLTQHFGLSPRWLDHIPMGGATRRGGAAPRRARRAGRRCRRSSPASRPTPITSTRSGRCSASFSHFARDAVYPYGSGGPNSIFAFITAALHAHVRRDARGLRQALRRPARQRAEVPARAVQKPLTLDEYLEARPIADRSTSSTA